MKEKIEVFDYASEIMKGFPKGILLNTQAEKFNSMIIGWGHLGIVWGKPTFHVYVREHRFTKEQLDKTDSFSVSVPLDKPDPVIMKVCGTLSGRTVDKVQEANLVLEEPDVIDTPALKNYPLTLECKKLYAQEQILGDIPEDIRKVMYPQDVDSSYYRANKDAHTMYIGEIVSAYIIK
ncbi:MAG: flavin reductase [Lachnospiraceae bacterium]|nr:flavin reductase [Lachnospiraceae bacterium]